LARRLWQWIEQTDPEFFDSAQPLPALDAPSLDGAPADLHRLCSLLAVASAEPPNEPFAEQPTEESAEESTEETTAESTEGPSP